jgi:hypothetical protein
MQERIEKIKETILKRAERVEKIYKNTLDRIVAPGIYMVTETDGGGWSEIDCFTVEVTKPINQKDLAVELIEKKNYMSPWNDLRIRKYQPKASITI